MFKKPLGELKTSAPLRNTERKKLRQRVVNELNIEEKEDGDVLVPEGLLMRKFATSSGEPGVAYTGTDGDPLWFSLGKGSDSLIPSVYTLWKRPRILPFLSTPKAVIPVLQNGADLMAAGVVQMSGTPEEGQLVAITQYEAGMLGPPLAVGRMAMAGSRIRAGERTGKAVHVIHVFNDKLWAMGSRLEPPPPEPMAVEYEVKDLMDEDGEDGEDARPYRGQRSPASVIASREGIAGPSTPPPLSEPVTEEEGDEQENVVKPQTVSDILRTSLLQAIATTASSLPASSFPLTASQFYTQHILPARPSFISTLAMTTQSIQSQVDIKHSTHKNLVAFLRLAEKDGLLKLKESKGKKSSGDAQVISVDATHSEIMSHQKYKTVGELDAKAAKRGEKAAAEAARPQEIRITEFWMPHGPSIRVFESQEKDSSVLYSQQEVKDALNAYIASKSLVNTHQRQFINIDEVLVSLFKSGENPEFLKRDELTRKLFDTMQPWHRIETVGCEPITKKGKLQPIHVTIKIRIGRKACTLVTHFEPFHLDANVLAEDLRKACASSTTIDELPGKNAGTEVMIQGKMTDKVKAYLLNKGVPKGWIFEEDLTAAKKKK